MDIEQLARNLSSTLDKMGVPSYQMESCACVILFMGNIFGDEVDRTKGAIIFDRIRNTTVITVLLLDHSVFRFEIGTETIGARFTSPQYVEMYDTLKVPTAKDHGDIVGWLSQVQGVREP